MNPELQNKQDAALNEPDMPKVIHLKRSEIGLQSNDMWCPSGFTTYHREDVSPPAIETGAVAKAVEALRKSTDIRDAFDCCKAYGYNKALDDALEAIRSCEGGWQDISTAPKDGTEILVGGGNCPYVHVNRFFNRGIPEISKKVYLRGLGDNEQPTHWQPLPAAPTHGEKE